MVQTEIDQKESRILELKADLNLSDYKVTRTIEGYEVSEEILTKREQERIEIRTLELEINDLYAQLLEESKNLIAIGNEAVVN